MRLDILANPRADHQRDAAAALAEGAGRHGVKARVVADLAQIRAPVAACWGWRNGKQLQAQGARVLVMERGYIGDRLKWTSLGFDGLNGRARFPVVNDGGARFRMHFRDLMQPVREARGAYALVCGQVAGDAATQGVDLAKFYRTAAQRLQADYGARVVFRPHPREVGRRGHPGNFLHGMTVQSAGGTLAEALEHADCVVAYNSNALVEAALAGLPLIAEDKGAMAWPVSGHGLCDQPRLQGRDGWAWDLAWCQWSLEEIARGDAWEALRTVLETEVAA